MKGLFGWCLPYLCLLHLGLELAIFAPNFILEGNLDLKDSSFNVIKQRGSFALFGEDAQSRENWVLAIDEAFGL